MPITDWPEEDRPREKLLAKGVQSLTNAELIAISLAVGTRGKTALDIARELLNEFGSLRQLRLAPSHLVMKKQGIGRTRYAVLAAAMELGKRCLNEVLPKGALLNNSKTTHLFLADKLRDHSNEVFACLFLDNHLRLICFEELFYGTINETSVYPREIVRRGLAHNAAKIILAHNHPSGQPLPSTADQEVTTLIKQAVELVDMEVVDHLIIGNPDHFSFAEAGLI